jgi:hypothetical protein
MSSLEEKLAEPELLPGARARRTLDTLRCCRGYQVLAGSEARPVRVSITPMDETTVWVRVPGLRATFELVPAATGQGEGV